MFKTSFLVVILVSSLIVATAYAYASFEVEIKYLLSYSNYYAKGILNPRGDECPSVVVKIAMTSTGWMAIFNSGQLFPGQIVTVESTGCYIEVSIADGRQTLLVYNLI